MRQAWQNLKLLASLERCPTSATRYNQTIADAARALKALNFTDGGDTWSEVEKRFNELTATTDGLLHRSYFGQCVGINKKSKEFAGKLFDALARRRNISGDSITYPQLKEFWEQISDRSFDCRLRTFFDIIDKEAGGRITEEDVREIIMLVASTSMLSNIEKQADDYAKLIMEELDHNGLGYIMIESLEMLMLHGPSQSVSGTNQSQNLKMQSGKLQPTQDHSKKRWFWDFIYFLQDYWKRVWVMAVWIGVMAVLFAYKYIQYKNKAAFDVMGHCVCFAKGAAETLKLNMAIILLPVCRKTITWLREKTALGVAVSFNDDLNFHKVIAVAIALGVGIHGISHLACNFPRLLHATPEEYEPMEQFFGNQPTGYWHFISGWEGLTGVVMVVLMAIAITLATSMFWRNKVYMGRPWNKIIGSNAFWYSHHLFVIVYACLVIHGIKIYLIHEWYKKTTWMYLAVPVSLYTGEKLISAFRSNCEAVNILKVVIYPGHVMALHMSKPQGFTFKSGQYIFIRCAAVSPFEWHPFAIASAPMDEYVSVYIRTLGGWTLQLRHVFSEACPPPPIGKSGLLRANSLQEGNNPNFPIMLIAGPYGAASQDYEEYDIVLLVSLGIGATPMVSVVKDIVNNLKAVEEEDSALEVGNSSKTGSRGRHNFKTRRAYSYWITREESSFEWFRDVMSEVAEMDHMGVIEIHNYCTNLYNEQRAHPSHSTLLGSLEQDSCGLDIVPSARVKTHSITPNWHAVFRRISLNHPNETVGVFYCGTTVLERELRKLASVFSRMTTTKFEFHKENF